MDREGIPPRYRLFVGVAIAATTATVAWRGPGESADRTITIEQSPQGFAALQRRLAALGHEPAEVLVVMEATGGAVGLCGDVLTFRACGDGAAGRWPEQSGGGLPRLRPVGHAEERARSPGPADLPVPWLPLSLHRAQCHALLRLAVPA